MNDGGKPRLQVIRGDGASGQPAGGEPLRVLYEKYGAGVYGRCVYVLKDRTKAEDAMQDVFAKALEHYASFRADASPLTWLMKIATHHCLNVLRGERAGWRARFDQEQRARPAGHGGPQVFEMRDLVRQLLGRVDLETQLAVVHYHVDEMTLEEVAALLDRSVPTIRKRLDDFSSLCEKERRHDESAGL